MPCRLRSTGTLTTIRTVFSQGTRDDTDMKIRTETYYLYQRLRICLQLDTKLRALKTHRPPSYMLICCFYFKVFCTWTSSRVPVLVITLQRVTGDYWCFRYVISSHLGSRSSATVMDKYADVSCLLAPSRKKCFLPGVFLPRLSLVDSMLLLAMTISINSFGVC